jgi:hypothetical protein
VLGELTPGQGRFIVAVEGKGPKDPLDRPFVGRKMSAVDQAYRYAINLPCDWIIVTSMRQTRLYHKGSDQHTYERFDTDTLAKDEGQLKRFLFLLGSVRVVPTVGQCHLHELLNSSEKVGRELTKEFYLRYADMHGNPVSRKPGVSSFFQPIKRKPGVSSFFQPIKRKPGVSSFFQPINEMTPFISSELSRQERKPGVSSFFQRKPGVSSFFQPINEMTPFISSELSRQAEKPGGETRCQFIFPADK